MRHQVDGRKFGRNTSHRLAMFRNMAGSLIEHERIQTTTAKAKELRRVVEKLITLSKKGDLASKRLAFSRLRDRSAVTKLFGELSERYSERSGGYTRILKLAHRRLGDAADVSIIELVDHPEINRKKPRKKDEEGGEENQVVEETAAEAKKPAAKKAVKKTAKKKAAPKTEKKKAQA